MSTVTLSIYDLSRGMARQLSPAFLGKQIGGIWHTGVRVFNKEYYFGGGICRNDPGRTPFGLPEKIHSMGTTTKTEQEFAVFLASVSHRFSPTSYHLLDNNCNNFSDECCRFLVGAQIPPYILDLPREAMESPVGPMLRPVIEGLQSAILEQSESERIELPTAASRETPPAASSVTTRTSTSAVKPSPTAHITSTPIKLSKANKPAILRKLQSFAPHLFDASQTADTSALAEPELGKLLDFATDAKPQHAFPALDLLRLAALEASRAEQLAPHIAPLVERYVTPASASAAATMALRLAANALTTSICAKRIAAPPALDVLLDALAETLQSPAPDVADTKPETAPTPSPQAKAAAVLLRNLATAPHTADVRAPHLPDEAVTRLLFVIHERLSTEPPPSAQLATPLLESAAVLCDGDPAACGVLSAYGCNLARYETYERFPDHEANAAVVILRSLQSEM